LFLHRSCPSSAVYASRPDYEHNLFEDFFETDFQSFLSFNEPDPATDFSGSCLPEVRDMQYAFYKSKCPGGRDSCEGAPCADALDAFKCCLKHSNPSALELQKLGMVAIGLTRWEALELLPVWLNIRRTLITKGEECRIKGFEPQRSCSIPDLPPVVLDLDPEVEASALDSQISLEVSEALNAVERRKAELREDIDEYGLGEEIEEMERLIGEENRLKTIESE
jgi:hypothetical protein